MRVLNLRLGCFAILFLASAAISQEATWLASNRSLNLAELTAKDTASFETYSRRLALVQDSISATHKAIESTKKNTILFMPKLEPKDEYERQVEYDARKAKWDKELFDRTERDTKSNITRLAELEKAKKKIEENQVSLYSSVNIKSSPEAASIWLNEKEIGTTPADYSLLIPGTVKISISKEGYNPWDTTFVAASKTKYKLYADLEEKSIFSTENEIDFVKFLSKNTTVEGYEDRIRIIEARKEEVGEEIKKMLEDFGGEQHKVAEFQRKYEVYKQKLERSVVVLNDYIIATQSMVVSEPSFGAKIELGAYDADKEQFELTVQDSASEKSPFLFKGRVGVPRDTAKAMNRTVSGFVASLQFINFPFEAGAGKVNLAMSRLSLSKNGLDLKVEGSFNELMRYRFEAGYEAWRLRADSLLSGSLKPQGLGYTYAMGAKEAAEDVYAAKSEDSGGGLGWRGWTRIIAFTAAAALGGFAVYKHLEAQRKKDDLKDLIKKASADDSAIIEADWLKEYDENADVVRENESQRNIYGGAAGVFAAGGIVTFFF
jgi:hypothetical protein